MKKLSTLFAALMLCISAAICQTPAITMTTALPVGSDFSFRLGTHAKNTLIQVDFGDGTLVTKIIGEPINIAGEGDSLISGKLVGSQTVKVYGEAITNIICSSLQLTNLDVSEDISLTEFFCEGNQLTSLDVSHNLALNYFDCANNQLTTLNIGNTYLKYLYCNDNYLTILDVSKVILWILNCQNNRLTFATLPSTIPLFGLVGAPQSLIPIPKTLVTGIEIDLSSQLTVNGNTTVYTWKTQTGTTLSEGTDYTLTDGKTVFLKAQTDSVYCEMTNATFPNFTGDVSLKTTYTKVSGTVGIEETAAEPDIQIFARNKTIYINALTNGQATVYDISGRLVAAKEITAGDNTIALQKGGVYLVRFTGNKVPVTKKVFIGN